MAKSKGKKYRGDLATPIPYGHALAAALRTWKIADGAPDQTWVREWLRDEQMRRVSLLFQHYGIEQDAPGAWYLLAQALANDHVPGFRIVDKDERPVGRPRKHPSKALKKLLSSGTKPPGPQRMYSDAEIDFVLKWIPCVQIELENRGKRSGKRAAITAILEVILWARGTFESRRQARLMAESHAKRVHNLILEAIPR